jgi:hypothetical protein
MSAWTKFATQFFHQKQKQNSDYKFSQALKEASKVYKKTKGGSRKQQGGEIKIRDDKSECKEDDPDYNDAAVCVEKVEEDIGKNVLDSTAANQMNTGEETTPGQQMLYKVAENGDITDEPCDPKNEAEYKNNEICKSKPVLGGKKSKRKSKKAGKKSQKKSKKAGSKKSKK